MFVYSSHEKWVFRPLLWSFPLSATLTSFPAPGCWAHAPAPTRASPARPACLFTVPRRIPFPLSLALSVPHPLSRVSLLFLLLITQFLFFPQVEVSLSRGLCCSHPGLSVGVPQYHEAHMVRVFPSRLGAGDWRPRDPLGFSVYREVEILSTSWGCGGVKVMSILSDYACKVCLWCLSKISL
jgi:hypothetical protein